MVGDIDHREQRQLPGQIEQLSQEGSMQISYRMGNDATLIAQTYTRRFDIDTPDDYARALERRKRVRGA